jgi:hypothetical protein
MRGQLDQVREDNHVTHNFEGWGGSLFVKYILLFQINPKKEDCHHNINIITTDIFLFQV